MKANSSYFTPGLFDFLRELATHNNRVWFQKNKERYESQVKRPMLRFIADFASPLLAIDPQYKADPSPLGGSLFRIYRDTRFSTDKSPYKTAVAARFPHTGIGQGVHAPCFYLHLEPGHCVGGGGLWQPDARMLHAIRQHMVNHPHAWQALPKKDLVFGGEKLKRVPVGYDAKHVLAEELKRKDFYAYESFSEEEVCSPAWMNRYVEVCHRVKPLLSFINQALEVPYA